MLAAAAALAAPTTLEADALLKERDKWHEKEVTVKAKVADFQAKTSKKGNKYTVFKLVDGSAKVNVYARGHLTGASLVKNGDTAVVTGVFRKEKKVFSAVFRNEIDATSKAGKPFGVKKAAPASG